MDEVACLAAAVRWDAWAHPDARERSPVRQPLAAQQQAECSWEAQLRAERARLRAVQQELVDESVLPQQEQQASLRLERLHVPALP